MKKILLTLLTCGLALTANAADRDVIKFDKHISGPTLTQADLEGKIVVAHAWQAH